MPTTFDRAGLPAPSALEPLTTTVAEVQVHDLLADRDHFANLFGLRVESIEHSEERTYLALERSAGALAPQDMPIVVLRPSWEGGA